MGRRKGDYQFLHPNQHVNLSQSTNDVYPTAMQARATPTSAAGRRHGGAARAFEPKADEFADIVKIGRTQLQDAVPMTLGQEFNAYASTLAKTRPTTEVRDAAV